MIFRFVLCMLLPIISYATFFVESAHENHQLLRSDRAAGPKKPFNTASVWDSKCPLRAPMTCEGANGKVCRSMDSECDSVSDCIDGSDEKECSVDCSSSALDSLKKTLQDIKSKLSDAAVKHIVSILRSVEDTSVLKGVFISAMKGAKMTVPTDVDEILISSLYFKSMSLESQYKFMDSILSSRSCS